MAMVVLRREGRHFATPRLLAKKCEFDVLYVAANRIRRSMCDTKIWNWVTDTQHSLWTMDTTRAFKLVFLLLCSLTVVLAKNAPNQQQDRDDEYFVEKTIVKERCQKEQFAWMEPHQHTTWIEDLEITSMTCLSLEINSLDRAVGVALGVIKYMETAK
ncbi:hypothetical protein RND71_035499 [Anisodus tanguticus]|uniref:Uncharacterized protein n=1 Tax=Anisodus tanguticus TaxID=243964 RepID=A0AAE1UUI4_9SOLA|nr:hypothetical protein RND71_035499 [Anisodus tanguticus]